MQVKMAVCVAVGEVQGLLQRGRRQTRALQLRLGERHPAAPRRVGRRPHALVQGGIGAADFPHARVGATGGSRWCRHHCWRRRHRRHRRRCRRGSWQRYRLGHLSCRRPRKSRRSKLRIDCRGERLTGANEVDEVHRKAVLANGERTVAVHVCHRPQLHHRVLWQAERCPELHRASTAEGRRSVLAALEPLVVDLGVRKCDHVAPPAIEAALLARPLPPVGGFAPFANEFDIICTQNENRPGSWTPMFNAN